jgi:hypothetical protein
LIGDTVTYASLMASPTATLRKHLSAPGLIATLRQQFSQISDHRRAASIRYSLPDTLCAALAMFQFKFPSLLRFDEACHQDDVRMGNLRRLYSLNEVASDTQMRSILDPVKPAELRKAFRAIHSSAQRGKVLEDFAIFDNQLLLSIDGTGLFSSTKVSCPHCGVKKHQSGETSFYHQLLAAAIVHPDQKTVLPLDFEPIVRSDGDTKNDCERNAGKRLLDALNQQYAKRSFIVLEDALAANGPHIQTLLDYAMSFIINIKPAGNATLFEHMHERCQSGNAVEAEEALDDGTRRGYRFAEDLPLNDSHSTVRVNMLEYWVVDKKGKTTNFSWITNLSINTENVHDIAQAARTRWAIENGVFNTLKNQGYEFEHNYGHGKQYLSSTLAGLMLLAFLTDQLQNHACALFKAARGRARVQKKMWETMRSIIELVDIPDWETLWTLIARPGDKKAMLTVVDSG